MRIAVGGKGGSGKTTIAATLARVLARRGYTVNAMDDDPNPNLAVALGIPPEQVARLGRLPDTALEERTDARGEREIHLALAFDRVVSEHGVRGPDGVGLLRMTGLLGAGTGCLCGQHVAVQNILGDRPGGATNDVTILDMEASLEHLARGTVRHADVMLVVTEPYYRSLETTGRLVPLARELGIPRVWVVANKVRNERDETAIREYCGRHNFELVGVVPHDQSVIEADQIGQALIDAVPDAPAVRSIEALAETVWMRFGTPAADSVQKGAG
jgi:CO dehydrogenase maturation factor